MVRYMQKKKQAVDIHKQMTLDRLRCSCFFVDKKIHVDPASRVEITVFGKFPVSITPLSSDPLTHVPPYYFHPSFFYLLSFFKFAYITYLAFHPLFHSIYLLFAFLCTNMTDYGSIKPRLKQYQQQQELTQAERDLLQADRPGYGTRHVIEVAFNLVNATVGAGIMGLPFAVSRAGFFTGVASSIWVAVLSQLGLYMLILAGKRVGIYKFAVLVEHVMGRFGYHFLNFVIVAQAGGACVSYFICKSIY